MEAFTSDIEYSSQVPAVHTQLIPTARGINKPAPAALGTPEGLLSLVKELAEPLAHAQYGLDASWALPR